MSGPVRHTAFDTAHPAVAAVYAVATLALTMVSLQPVLIALSFAGGFAYSCCVRGFGASLASLRWQLPFILLVAVLNPLFSASGSTELFRLGGRAVYLESLCYGCAMGGLFVSSALWFQGAAHMLPFDRVMALLGNAAPVLALMVSQGMRLVPRLVRQGGLIGAAQEASLPRRRRVGELRDRLRLSTVLMGWSLEDSLETADAMRARGWGAAPRRITYTRYRFTADDAAAVLALAAGAALSAAVSFAATSQFEFYPTMSSLVAWWGYAPYALWMLVPALLHVREERRFS